MPGVVSGGTCCALGSPMMLGVVDGGWVGVGVRAWWREHRARGCVACLHLALVPAPALALTHSQTGLTLARVLSVGQAEGGNWGARVGEGPGHCRWLLPPLPLPNYPTICINNWFLC